MLAAYIAQNRAWIAAYFPRVDIHITRAFRNSVAIFPLIEMEEKRIEPPMRPRSLPLVTIALASGLFLSPLLARLNAEPVPLAAKIENAEFPAKSMRSLPPEVIAKAQILLDQAHFSPGEIDAKPGENLGKAVKAFAEARGLRPDSKLTKNVWDELVRSGSGSMMIEYVITDDDLKGPFVPNLPSKMEDMKDLPALPYRSARELLAERFHLSEDLLKRLNGKSTFDRSDETIVVPNVRPAAQPVHGANVEIDKKLQTVRIFDGDKNLVAFYPATVGSDEKPSPSGVLKITNVQHNPYYRYNPSYHFKGVSARKPFTIKPGPNNPVGTVWIGLSAKGYGIHGTPEPGKVSKAESHGCVRLTNWDAEGLAKMVSRGTSVAFVETQSRENGRPGQAGRRAKQ